jgi:hypothetical protein
MRKLNILMLVVGLVVLGGLIPAAQAQPPYMMLRSEAGFDNGSYDDSSAANPLPYSFSKEACEQNCRSNYGVDMYFRGSGDNRGQYYAYAACIQQCNTAFWKDFDSRMRDLERQK